MCERRKGGERRTEKETKAEERIERTAKTEGEQKHIEGKKESEERKEG